MNLQALIDEVQSAFDCANLSLSLEDFDKFLEAVKEMIYG